MVFGTRGRVAPHVPEGLATRISTTPPAEGGSVVEEARSEANVPAQQSSPSQAARFPAPHVDASRTPSLEGPSLEGAAATVGLIWRVRDRGTFDALRQYGRRSRSGPVRVTHLPAKTPSERHEPPRVAFAVSRRVGSAVVRNRIRRRLRGVLVELAQDVDSPLRPGAYLIGVDPGAVALSHEELRSNVTAALERVGKGRE